MSHTGPETLSAAAALAAMDRGALTSVDLVLGCLGRIDSREPRVKAWLHVAGEQALAMAEERDRERASGCVRGALHGIPFAAKDVIDVAGMPGTHNSPLHAGRVPVDDAACVALMRAAGAVPLGKTDTVEFAALGRLASTTNPHRETHTPGGSSSGSGAAVADLHVPIAFGTQTGGSVMRPAAYCGTYAMKPSWGVVSREGFKLFAPSLDTVGWYARGVADLRLVGEASGLPPAERPCRSVATLRIALCHTPYAERARPGAMEALHAAAEALRRAGATVEVRELPPSLDGLDRAKDVIMRGEGRAAFLPHLKIFGDRLHPGLRGHAENRTGISPQVLKASLDYAAHARTVFEGHYRGFDAVLTFGATGEADPGLESNGDSVMNSLWTLLHVPVVAIPAGLGPGGLPVGVQLVGFRFADGELLDVAETVAPLIDPHHDRPRIPR